MANNDVGPAVRTWRENERQEDHHARDRDVRRYRKEERLRDLDPRDLPRGDLFDVPRHEEPEDVPVREQEQHRDQRAEILRRTLILTSSNTSALAVAMSAPSPSGASLSKPILGRRDDSSHLPLFDTAWEVDDSRRDR